MTVDHSYQRPFHVSKSLRELIRKPRQQKKQHDLTLPLPSLPDDAGTPNDYVYDILYECQRGSWMVGYSSKTLLQFDASPWCDANMEYTPMDTKTYQLPDPTWQWVSKEWMVDMSGDVDEAGWQYSLKFHGAVWHGNYKHFRSFVRRRRWIRLRRRLPQHTADSQAMQQLKRDSVKLVDVDNIADYDDENNDMIDKPRRTSSMASSSSSVASHEELVNALGACRLDRERLVVFERALSISNASKRLFNAQVLNMFDFQSSKCLVLRRILELRYSSHNPAPSSSLIQLTAEEKELLQTLGFYSDMQNIIDEFEDSH
ncbi:hypothetical protein BDB00DRAFT_873353 [Zychaea mexicana]|uniref:uncharacterized protein n=1 Tax=Zychaea mexicana TaxID=64656 RepID=UPI0022FDDA27|nr:uncharacterized protein BDB00DRAFT_873353 [Zychaea mexicana]KAI9492441.1 hypothetical protein BDB00DRAFT_873353 [Zychaea mexicana]